MNKLRLFFRAWTDMRRFQKRRLPENSIVFYTEGIDYWKFFESIVEHLIKTHDQQIVWLTSDHCDPLITSRHPGIEAFFIGEGIWRTVTLNTIKANLMIMTLPDLGSSYIKRSTYDVHYVYLFHSMVSTHMIYKKGAFDHFDSIMCVGEHHIEEIREWEVLNNLPAKQLFNHGYGVLDKLLEEKENRSPPAIDKPRHVLVAPSWGPEGLLETSGVKTVKVLLEAGFQVTVRPHPMTCKNAPNAISRLASEFGGHPAFNLDKDTGSSEALFMAHVMVSDWSGVALEFAFGLGKPVIFLDVPKKLNNAEYSLLKAIPIEISLRGEIGKILPLEDIKKLPSLVTDLTAHPVEFEKNIRELKDKYVFNVGKSAAKGAEIIKSLSKSHAYSN